MSIFECIYMNSFSKIFEDMMQSRFNEIPMEKER